MNGYIIAALAGVSILAVGVAGFQSYRVASISGDLDGVRQTLSSTQSDLEAERSSRAEADRAYRMTQAVLADERQRADAANRTSTALREQIARDAGTDRDGPTAPVLEDTIKGLSRTQTRQDALFNGRRETWHLVVVIAGSIVASEELLDGKTCKAAALAAAEKLMAMPTFESHLRGHVTISCAAGRPTGAA